MTFQPGRSGNPGGRFSFKAAAKAAGFETSEITKELVATAIEWMRRGDRVRAKHAHQWLADMLFGRPKIALDVTGDLGLVGVDLATLSTADLERLIADGAEVDPDGGSADDPSSAG